jgi:hypothetical protein
MRKLNLFAGMALAAMVLVGLTATADKTSAGFTATSTNPGNSFATATLTMSNDKSTAGQLITITGLVPGDTMPNRQVVITNSGSAPFTYTAAVSAPATPTALWTDLTNGIQVTAYRGAAQLYSGPLSGLSLPASGTIAAGGTDTLTYNFTFPSSATDSFQNLTQTFTITYTAAQLAGSAK